MIFTIKNAQILPDKQGFYNLDTVFEVLNTESFIRNSTMAGRERVRPIPYLESQSAKQVTHAVLNENRCAYRVEFSPTGGVFVCKELLIDYAKYRSPGLFVDLVNQLFSQPEIETDSKNKHDNQECHDFLELFFEAFHDINFVLEDQLNHSNNPDELAINISQATKFLKDGGVEMPYRKWIIRYLKNHRLYIGNRSIKSKVWNKNCWCFIFKRG